MSENVPAKTSASEVAKFQAAQFAAKKAMLENEAAISNGEDSNLTQWIQGKLTAILEAEDFNAINQLMTETGLNKSKDLIGRTFEIQDFVLRESADAFREQGSQLQKYAIIQAVDTSTGEEFMIDGGGDQFISGLVRMRDLYNFPYVGTLLGMTTGSGNTMLYWRFSDPKRAKVQ